MLPQLFQIKTIDASLIRPSDTTTYAAGDAVSAVTTNNFLTFEDITGTGQNDRAATILTAVITSSGQETLKPDLELWLFDTVFTKIADNAAFTVSDTEILTHVGTIDFSNADWKSATASSTCLANNVNIDFTDDGTTRQLYGQLVVRNAYIPISAEKLQVRLVVAQYKQP